MNAFLTYGDSARPSRRQVPPSPALTARLREQTALSKAYHAARQKWIDQALDCPEGPRVLAMLDWVRTLGPGDADELVEVVAGEDWLLAAPQEVRFVALQLIGEEICRIRRQAGLRELDDPLPGDPDTAFLMIRRLLNP